MSTPRSSSRLRRSSASRVQRPFSSRAVDELHALPGRLQVDVVATEGDLRRPDRLLRDGLDELLDAGHRVLVVRVGLVPLDHRELGRVLVGHALVAEVLRELVDALEAADDEALEVELGRDAEVEVLVELVRVRHERVGERAAVAGLEDGRLDLDEAALVEVAPDRGDHAGAQLEVGARLLAHQQVDVTLPVAGLGVGQAVEGVGQRPLDLGEQLELGDGERRLTALRLGGDPGDADDVAEVEVDGPGAILGHEQLDLPGAVDEVEEDELPHVPPSHDPPGHPPRLAAPPPRPRPAQRRPERKQSASRSGNLLGKAIARESKHPFRARSLALNDAGQDRRTRRV